MQIFTDEESHQSDLNEHFMTDCNDTAEYFKYGTVLSMCITG